jgi:hypothetical protein
MRKRATMSPTERVRARGGARFKDVEIKYLEQPYELIERPLDWQKQGLQQTSSGYGAKLTSTRCVKLADGRVRRVYITCYSNAGSAWITLDRERFYLPSEF